MFEQSVLRERKRSRKGWMIAAAVGIHGVALATVVLASAWSVDDVAPPMENALFTPPMDVTYLAFQEPQKPTVTPPAPPIERPAAPPAHHEEGPTQPAPPQETQPTTVPSTVPTTTDPGPEVGPTTTASDTPVTGTG